MAEQGEERRAEERRGEGELLRRAATRWKQRSAVGVTQLFFFQPAKKKEKKKQLRSDSGADKTATRSTAETNAFNSFVTSGHLKKQT